MPSVIESPMHSKVFTSGVREALRIEKEDIKMINKVQCSSIIIIMGADAEKSLNKVMYK